MSKRSALTAALSGAPAPAVPLKASASSLLPPDNYAFPCLLCAPDDGTSTSVDSLSDAIEAVDLKTVTIVGSAPTNTVLPNGKELVSAVQRVCLQRCYWHNHPQLNWIALCRTTTPWIHTGGGEARRPFCPTMPRALLWWVVATVEVVLQPSELFVLDAWQPVHMLLYVC